MWLIEPIMNFITIHATKKTTSANNIIGAPIISLSELPAVGVPELETSSVATSIPPITKAPKPITETIMS